MAQRGRGVITPKHPLVIPRIHRCVPELPKTLCPFNRFVFQRFYFVFQSIIPVSPNKVARPTRIICAWTTRLAYRNIASATSIPIVPTKKMNPKAAVSIQYLRKKKNF